MSVKLCCIQYDVISSAMINLLTIGFLIRGDRVNQFPQ